MAEFINKELYKHFKEAEKDKEVTGKLIDRLNRAMLFSPFCPVFIRKNQLLRRKAGQNLDLWFNYSHDALSLVLDRITSFKFPEGKLLFYGTFTKEVEGKLEYNTTILFSSFNDLKTIKFEIQTDLKITSEWKCIGYFIEWYKTQRKFTKKVN